MSDDDERRKARREALGEAWRQAQPQLREILSNVSLFKSPEQDELERIRRLLEAEREPLPPRPLARKGGRPPNMDDVWAHEQVYNHHRPAQEVRAEWRQRNVRAARFLKDEDRTWRAAMKEK